MNQHWALAKVAAAKLKNFRFHLIILKSRHVSLTCRIVDEGPQAGVYVRRVRVLADCDSLECTTLANRDSRVLAYLLLSQAILNMG